MDIGLIISIQMFFLHIHRQIQFNFFFFTHHDDNNHIEAFISHVMHILFNGHIIDFGVAIYKRSPLL